MKYLVFSKDKLNDEIAINNLGISFRKLNSDETTEITNIFNELFFSKQSKNRINKYYIEYAKNKESNTNKAIMDKYLIKHFKSLTDEQNLINVLYYNYVIKENIIFNKRVFNNLLKKIAIIEVDHNILEGYIEVDQFNTFILNLLKCGFMVNGLKRKQEIDIFEYQELLSKRDLISMLFIDMIKGIDNCFSFYSNVEDKLDVIKNIHLNLENKSLFILNSIYEFINSCSIEEIRSFIIITNMIFQNNSFIENEIVNYTSAIERTLMNKKEEKTEKFTLKVGIIIHELTKVNNELLKKQLDFCYNVRSCVVHGNENELMGYYSNLMNISIKQDDLVIDNDEPTKLKRKKILNEAHYILKTVVMFLMIYWVNNNEMIRFIKYN